MKSYLFFVAIVSLLLMGCNQESRGPIVTIEGSYESFYYAIPCSLGPNSYCPTSDGMNVMVGNKTQLYALVDDVYYRDEELLSEENYAHPEGEYFCRNGVCAHYCKNNTCFSKRDGSAVMATGEPLFFEPHFKYLLVK